MFIVSITAAISLRRSTFFCDFCFTTVWGIHKHLKPLSPDVGGLVKYTVFQKSDTNIQITITTAHLIRINYPLSSFNYRLSDTNVANVNKIDHMVSEQQLFKKWNLKTEFSSMENTS